MWVVIPFLKFVTDPLLAGRLVSAFAGLATVIGVGFTSFLLFRNLRQSVSAGLIWAVLPYAVFFDRMALADSMLVMFMVWAFAFTLLALRYGRWDMSMIAGFFLGFAWLTKSPAIISFMLLPLLLLFVGEGKLNRKNILVSLGLLATTYTIAFSMYNILRLGPEFHMIAIRNNDYVHPISEVLKHPTDPLIPHLKDSVDFYFYLLTPLGLGLAVLGLIEGGLKHWRQRLVLAIWWLAPIFALSFIAKTLTARYLLFTVPFSVILASHALWHFGDRTKKHFLTFTALGLLLLLSVGFDYLLITSPEQVPLPRVERAGYLEEWTSGYGLKETSDSIRQAAMSGPVVVGAEGFFGTPFSALQMYLNDVKNVRVVGMGLGISSISPDLTNALRDNQVFFVANSSRMEATPEQLNIDLLSAYPKAVAPDGSREYLIFGKVKPQSKTEK